MISPVENSGPYLLVAPRGRDLFMSPRGSSEPDPVRKDECSHPVGKGETAPLLNPLVLNHLQEKQQLRPSAPLRKGVYAHDADGGF